MIAQAHIGNKRDEFNELLDRSLKKNGILYLKHPI